MVARSVSSSFKPTCLTSSIVSSLPRVVCESNQPPKTATVGGVRPRGGGKGEGGDIEREREREIRLMDGTNIEDVLTV